MKQCKHLFKMFFQLVFHYLYTYCFIIMYATKLHGLYELDSQSIQNPRLVKEKHFTHHPLALSFLFVCLSSAYHPCTLKFKIRQSRDTGFCSLIFLLHRSMYKIMLSSEICHSEFPRLCYSYKNPQVFVIQCAQKFMKVLFTLHFLSELARGHA